MNTLKGTPLSKEEVSLLIDLIEGNKVITSKATNATNNRLKEAAWLDITETFNASISSCPRRMVQLKLKWENLKKAARKRSASINFNLNKTSGGMSEYIPPDDSLDRVASLLGTTCEGYNVPFGGDAESLKDSQIIVTEFGGEDTIIINNSVEGEGDAGRVGNLKTTPQTETNKNFFSTHRKNNVLAKRKRKLEEDDIKARISRNKAIAKYYIEKRRKLELETENLELANRKLKLELENFNK